MSSNNASSNAVNAPIVPAIIHDMPTLNPTVYAQLQPPEPYILWFNSPLDQPGYWSKGNLEGLAQDLRQVLHGVPELSAAVERCFADSMANAQQPVVAPAVWFPAVGPIPTGSDPKNQEVVEVVPEAASTSVQAASTSVCCVRKNDAIQLDDVAEQAMDEVAHDAAESIVDPAVPNRSGGEDVKNQNTGKTVAELLEELKEAERICAEKKKEYEETKAKNEKKAAQRIEDAPIEENHNGMAQMDPLHFEPAMEFDAGDDNAQAASQEAEDAQDAGEDEEEEMLTFRDEQELQDYIDSRVRAALEAKRQSLAVSTASSASSDVRTPSPAPVAQSSSAASPPISSSAVSRPDPVDQDGIVDFEQIPPYKPNKQRKWKGMMDEPRRKHFAHPTTIKAYELLYGEKGYLYDEGETLPQGIFKKLTVQTVKDIAWNNAQVIITDQQAQDRLKLIKHVQKAQWNIYLLRFVKQH